MSLLLPNKYPGRFDPVSADYPQGEFKNRSSPTAQDGSYMERDWLNDWAGFFGALLHNTGATPNGNVDTAQSSQTYDALINTIRSSLLTVGGSSLRNLKLSSTGLSPNVTITADLITLDSTVNSPPLLVRQVNLSPSINASGLGGLDAGVSVSNTWYSVWVVSDGTNHSALFSLSATAPTMPPGYTYHRRVGWMRSDSSPNKHPLAFRQCGELVEYTMQGNTNYYPTMVSGAVGTITASSYTPVSVSVDSFVPPSTIVGIRFKPHNPDTGFTLAVTPVASSFYGGFDSATPPDFMANPDFYGAVYDMTLASRSIYVASGSAGGRVFCVGWRDAL